MNRIFGTEINNNEFNEEINNNKINKNNNINNKGIIKKKISTKTYKVKRPRVNFNYNNYIKNTININNNNTNIFFEEDDFNKNIFSKSQMITMESNANKKNQINKTINSKNNNKIMDNAIYNNSQIIEPVLKKGKINISKKVFIKPKLKNKSVIINNPNKNVTQLIKADLYKNVNMDSDIEEENDQKNMDKNINVFSPKINSLQNNKNKIK